MRARLIGVLCVAGLAASAGAQDINFSWSDDDDGDGVYQPGQTVNITLTASWNPTGVGYAGSIFGVSGLEAMFANGGVTSVRPAHLGALSPGMDGTATDTDASGTADFLDNVDTFQLPPFFNPGFDATNPMDILTITLVVDAGATGGSGTLQRVAALNGTFTSDVYQDNFGTSIPYNAQDKTHDYIIAPAPSSLALLGLGGLVAARRRR